MPVMRPRVSLRESALVLNLERDGDGGRNLELDFH
jgi:hypothetical protein